MNEGCRGKRRHHGNKRSIFRFPDRWARYNAIVKNIPGTRFLPFKTPLRAEYFVNRDGSFKSEQAFEIKTLINHVANLGKDLGLVIDLTATRKYYDPHEYEKYNIEYVKLSCAGHFVDKDEKTARQFVNIVSRFLSNNADNGKLVGVHCTHGLNRTGFLICKYLIEVDGFSPEDAIKKFEQGRGHKIERIRYIDALQDCIRGKSAYLCPATVTKDFNNSSNSIASEDGFPGFIIFGSIMVIKIV